MSDKQQKRGGPFLVTRRKRGYSQDVQHPKISIDKTTYEALQEVAYQSKESISQIAIRAIAYAICNIEYTDEV